MKSDLPSPYDYLDFRRYLAEWFKAKKIANPRFSHRLFARLAGQRSPSLLHHVIEGRRNLTNQTTDSFIQALSLRAGEANFFRLLVTLDQAKNPDARNEAWDQIAATRRFREARQVDRGAFEFLSNWTMPAIHELASRPDFQADPAWIADTLRPRVLASEAKQALDTLVALGLLVDEEGTLVPADVSVATPPEVAGLAAYNYHKGMLARASEAIDTFEGSERHMVAITVGVPESLIPTLKSEANAFLERMMHLCDAQPDDTDRVVQMNVQVFPLSAPREDS